MTSSSKLKLHTFRIGTPRTAVEGIRLGTVRHLPRGVKREAWAELDYFDAWFPLLAPSAELVRVGRAAESPKDWQRFAIRYQKEMQQAQSREAIRLVALVAKQTPISVGCYCEDENRCHRSILRDLIEQEA